MDRELLAFKIGDRVYSKNKKPVKWDLNGDPDTGLSILSTTDITYTLKTRLLENKIMQCQRCSTQTTSRIVEH